MKAILLVIAVTASLTVGAQINMEDSTAQVVAYWTKGEKQRYKITTEKYKINKSDTSGYLRTTSDVEVTILDSTENSYTVEWLYRNVDVTNDDPLVKRFMKVNENLKVIYKTKELGSFVEVLNWKDITNVVAKATAELKKEFVKLPGADKVLDEFASVYHTKAGIEAGAIKEIRQFHFYHGAKYKLRERLKEKRKVANMVGGASFDSDMRMYLDNINEEERYVILSYWEVVDRSNSPMQHSITLPTWRSH